MLLRVENDSAKYDRIHLQIAEKYPKEKEVFV